MTSKDSPKRVQERKKIPQRSCIACRNKTNQGDLIRIVVTDNKVQIDTGGKIRGRGAYLCPLTGCWEMGLKKNRIEYALRTKLTSDNREMLLEYGRSLSSSIAEN